MSQKIPREIAFKGRWISSVDGVTVGENYTVLQNMRYTDAYPVGISGMTKINTTSIARRVKNMFHFKKDGTSESHLIVQAYTLSETRSYIYRNDTAIPDAGDFSSTLMLTGSVGTNRCYFSDAPNGNMAMCNEEGSYIWGGDELRIGGFINYGGGGLRDYTEILRNSLSDATNRAILIGASGGVDSSVKLLLHLENNVTDSSPTTPHTVTNTDIAFSSTVNVFGTYAANFTSATPSYGTIPDNADFDFSGGAFTIDTRVRVKNLATDACLWSQRTAGTDWIKFYITSTGAVSLQIRDTSSNTTVLETPAGVIATDTWYHVALAEQNDHWWIFVDGKIRAHATNAIRAKDYAEIVYVGVHHNNVAIASELNGYLDEFRVSSGAAWTAPFEIPDEAYDTVTENVYFYLGSTRPIKGFKAYVHTANANTSTVKVWQRSSGAWAQLSSVVDGTDGLQQTGSVTFPDTESTAEASLINSVFLYWYKVRFADVTPGTVIYRATVDASMQTFKDLWDGTPRDILDAQTYDAAAYENQTVPLLDPTYDSTDAATFVDLGGYTSSSKLILGFAERITGLEVNIGSGGNYNTTANTEITVKYWNGSSATSVGVVTDGTAEDNTSFAKTGTISWNSPSSSSEFTRTLNNSIPLFYYELSFDKTLSADVHAFYITGIPAQKKLKAYKFPLFASNRLFLCGQTSDYPNSVIVGSSDTADVFNGVDSTEIFFGSEEELTGGAWLYSQFGSNIYNVIAFTKATETWLLVGNGPSDWQRYRVSANIGCPSPQTIVVMNAPTDQSGPVNRTIAIWQSSSGIYLFDGRSFTPIHEDIADWFDARNSYSINRSMIQHFTAFPDTDNQSYHWCFASGSGSTTLNKELVYSLRYKKWHEIVRGAGNRIQCGCVVKDTEGNSYTYGGGTDGYVYRLENGNDFDGTEIACVVETGDIALAQGSVWKTTKIRNMKMIAKRTTSETSATLTITGDGATSGGTALTLTPMTNLTHNVSQLRKSENLGDYTFHRFRVEMSSASEPKGLQPIYLAVLYRVVRDDTTE